MIDLQIIFPSLFVFYKPNKASKRTFSKSVRNQNEYSIMTCVITDQNDYGTVKRNLKHKGYSQLVAILPATKEDQQNNKYRFSFRRFRAFSELWATRDLTNKGVKELTERLDQMFPCKSTGQIKLI